ncbi:MAG: ferric reductase-like transmembrane domain-containing protein [Devosiaceae bacterium]|nr:ferric reductase-like transmembrane domain-containing protein [Devosiaceae bacterium MH13]
MSKKAIALAAIFVMAHIALVAPFVPLASLLPAGLGALSLSSMALTLILAARWRLVDLLMGGPDKSYSAHRWLGFFALGGALGHWAMASSIGAGLFPVLSESGEGLGTIAAFGLIIMTAAALVRAIPYHLWKATHRLMGPIFLFAAGHTFLVASPLAIGAVPWTVMAILSAVGLLAWVQTLLRERAPTLLVAVERAEPFDGGIDVTLRADAPLPAFRPGQFATLAHNRARAEAHPFTIAGGDETSRRFVIRAAGDWTKDFVQNVSAGDELRLGPGVGRFLPQVEQTRTGQLWVAGGVGITPFLASLEHMEPDSAAQVTLIYCIRSRESAGALADVERHAARLPQLDLIVLHDKGGDRLTEGRLADIIRALAPDTQVYLCGPEGLKVLVKNVCLAAGMTGRIHSERFDFRGAYAITDLIYLGQPILNIAHQWIAGRRGVARADTES